MVLVVIKTDKDDCDYTWYKDRAIGTITPQEYNLVIDKRRETLVHSTFKLVKYPQNHKMKKKKILFYKK